MATREEIREGIYQILDGELTAGYMSNWKEFSKELTLEQRVDYVNQVVKLIVEREHSQGVVVKVKRKLPTDCISYLANEKGIIKSVWADEEKVKASGWEAVEPLIEE